MNKPTIYLCGAIRDGYDADVLWREEAIVHLSRHATILNPLGGKVYNLKSKVWTMSGIRSESRTIVKHDNWCVDQADIIIANLLALAQGYPNIGSLIEFGRATRTGALIYSIVNKEYTGHENEAMFRLHPFIAENSAIVFFDTESCIAFLEKHLESLSGAHPNFGGYTSV